LIVEDNAALRKGLSVRLRANGYEVLFAEDAISATAAIVTERPDLVILDLGLPRGDGFDVMERLHRSDRLANIPVIVLTGRELAGNRERALQAGAAAFFQKPMEGRYSALHHSVGPRYVTWQIAVGGVFIMLTILVVDTSITSCHRYVAEDCRNQRIEASSE
jgi:two-component system KDP operon response regulator KdpE